MTDVTGSPSWTNADRLSIVDECRTAAREAVRAELAAFFEFRGQQTEQIKGICSALARTEKLLSASTTKGERAASEMQGVKGRVDNLDRMAGNWELFRTDYQASQQKLDNMAETLRELVQAREKDVADREAERKKEAADREAQQQKEEKEKEEQRKAAAAQAAENRRQRNNHLWMLGGVVFSNVMMFTATLALHFMGAR